MKKLKLTLISLISGIVSFAQNGPFYMSYQAIVRDNNNQLVQNTQVGVRISILANGPQGDTAYAETHTVTTNINGLLDLAIGSGTQVFGSYAYKYIPWGDVNFYLKTEIDPTGGTNYTISSTSKMMSVPHSNYSHWSGALVGWASYYTGNYRAAWEPTFYLIISYVSQNQVMITMTDFEVNVLTGNAAPNQITIPETDIGECTWSGNITINENNLTLFILENCGGEIYELTLPYTKL